MPTDVLIVNIAVLFAVLEADLGRRKISTFRILRPLFLAAGIIPLFIAHPATAGNGEILEIALAGLGALLGVVAAGGLMKVSFDDASQRCVSTAGRRLRGVLGRDHRGQAPLHLRRQPLVQHPARPLDGDQRDHRRRPHRRPDLHGRGHGRHPHPPPGRRPGPGAPPRPLTSWRSEMTLTTIAIAIALIVFVAGPPHAGRGGVRAPKKLFLLPVVVGAIGLQNLSHAKPNAVDIGVIAAGCALSLVLGLLRGRLDKVSMVNGAPYMSLERGLGRSSSPSTCSPSWPSTPVVSPPGAPRPR